MIAKVNCGEILRAHFATMRNVNRKGVCLSDVAFFYLLPVAVSVAVVFCLGRTLGKDGVNFVAGIFAIFIGLLLNLLVIVFDQVKSAKAHLLSVRNGSAKPGPNDEDRLELLRETSSNISYAVLISVLALGLLFVARLVSGIYGMLVTAAIFSLAGNFLLTLLMVLKRVHILLSKEAA